VVPSVRGAASPDPLGKRALFWAPADAGRSDSDAGAAPSATTVLPVGKRALYSGAPVERSDTPAIPENPLEGRGMFTVRCGRCRQRSRVGLLDLLIFQFPIGVWLRRD
jgi:hypothetical protein